MSLMSAAGAAVGSHGRSATSTGPEDGSTLTGVGARGPTAGGRGANGTMRHGTLSFRAAGQPAQAEPMVAASTLSQPGSISPRSTNPGSFVPSAPQSGGPTPGRGAHSAQPSPTAGTTLANGARRGAAPRAGHARRAMGSPEDQGGGRVVRASGIDAAADFVTVGSGTSGAGGSIPVGPAATATGQHHRRAGGYHGVGSVPVAGFSPVTTAGVGAVRRRGGAGAAVAGSNGSPASAHRGGTIVRGRAAGRSAGARLEGGKASLAAGMVARGIGEGKVTAPAGRFAAASISGGRDRDSDMRRPISALANVAGAEDEEDVEEALDLHVRAGKRGGPKPRSAPNLILLAQNEGFPRDLTPATIKSPIRLSAGDLARGGLSGGGAGATVARASSFSVGGSNVQGLSGVFRRMVTSPRAHDAGEAGRAEGGGKEEEEGEGGGGAGGGSSVGMDGVMASAAMIVLHRLRKQRLAAGASAGVSSVASGSGQAGGAMSGLALSAAAASAAAQAESVLEDAARGSAAGDVASAAARADAFSAAADQAEASKAASRRLGAGGKMSAASVEKGYLLWELVRRRRDHVARMAALPEGHRFHDASVDAAARGGGGEDDEDDEEDIESPCHLG